ncbi:hypothetical protein J530_3335 [Acinetobacter baumannii 15827]|nr:hypothetical protein J530_3335 [Acinetobacter baumannii 15827]
MAKLYACEPISTLATSDNLITLPLVLLFKGFVAQRFKS